MFSTGDPGQTSCAVPQPGTYLSTSRDVLLCCVCVPFTSVLGLGAGSCVYSFFPPILVHSKLRVPFRCSVGPIEVL